MPRFYCDYCDVFLTHDSASVRRQHCSGRRHKDNVRTYFTQFAEQHMQSIIESKIREFESRGPIPGAPFARPPQYFPGPPQNQGMPPQNQGMPPPMPGMPPQMQGMPPPIPGMPPQMQGMPPPLPGMPPQMQGMPPPLPGIPPQMSQQAQN